MLQHTPLAFFFSFALRHFKFCRCCCSAIGPSWTRVRLGLSARFPPRANVHDAYSTPRPLDCSRLAAVVPAATSTPPLRTSHRRRANVFIRKTLSISVCDVRHREERHAKYIPDLYFTVHVQCILSHANIYPTSSRFPCSRFFGAVHNYSPARVWLLLFVSSVYCLGLLFIWRFSYHCPWTHYLLGMFLSQSLVAQFLR